MPHRPRLMPHIFAALAAAVLGCTATDLDQQPAPARAAGGTPAARVGTPSPPAPPDSVLRPAMPRVPTPHPVRGLYVNRWAAIGRRMWQLLELARTTEVNALVIDVKDDRGLLLYHSTVPLAREIGADTTQPMSYRRMRTVLDSMRALGVYPIARIVVAKDPLLAAARPEWAIARRSDGAPWLDRHGMPWLDPTHPEVWRYAADLAAEAVRLGFSEVQFDYVRFPDDDRIITQGSFAKMNGRVRAQVVHDQLAYLRALVKPLDVPMTIDVFGLTATDSTDMGIGQRWEMFVNQADVVLPMVYPSHFAPGTYGLGKPNARPYATIEHALRDAQQRSAGIPGAAAIVPWYQDFTLGPPRYGATQVRAQIQAGYDLGMRSWMLWNPRSAYTAEALRDSIRPEQVEAPERATALAGVTDSASTPTPPGSSSPPAPPP